MLFAIYVLSLGPVIALMDTFPPPEWLESVIDVAYVPLEWLYQHSSERIKRLFEAYIDWWYYLFD